MSGERRVVRDDPDFDKGACAVEFRLTYEGPLWAASASNTRVQHKHDIRRRFNGQLRQLWATEPYLSKALFSRRDANPPPPTIRETLVEHQRKNYAKLGYEFVPLVTEELRMFCAIDILFLRPTLPGGAIKSGDLDNRLKTLFDAMRMPGNKDELGGNDAPLEDEKPFYVLLSDDRLISKVSVETDRLLEPLGTDGYKDNDARLFITVRLKPFDMGWDNINFS